MTKAQDIAHLNSAINEVEAAGIDKGLLVFMAKHHVAQYEASAITLPNTNYKISRLISTFNVYSDSASVSTTAEKTCSNPTIDGSNIYEISPYAYQICSSNNGRNYFGFRGAADNNRFGRSVATGDLNGDGVDDVVVGADGANQGKAYVVYGSSAASGIYYIDFSNTLADVTFTGESSGDQFGQSVAIGDVTGDGVEDLIVAAVARDNAKGEVYIFYGSSALAPAIFAVNADVSFLGPTLNSLFGYDLLVVDVNGDSIEDIIIGAPAFTSGSNKGAVYVYYGSSSLSSDDSADVTLVGPDDNYDFGWSLGTGDVNGDGFIDIVVGAPEDSGTDDGYAYVFFGSSSGLESKDLSDSDTADISIDGGTDNFLGYSVDIGDVNGDGTDDVIVGAYGVSSNRGAVYIYFGSSSLSGTKSPADADITLEGASGGDKFGESVKAKDVTGDGVKDLIVGASGYDGGSNKGVTYIFFGGSSLASKDLSTQDIADVKITGESDNDQFGYSIDTGDYDNDGVDDLVVGAPQISGSSKGFCYIFFGGELLDNGSPSSDIFS